MTDNDGKTRNNSCQFSSKNQLTQELSAFQRFITGKSHSLSPRERKSSIFLYVLQTLSHQIATIGSLRQKVTGNKPQNMRLTIRKQKRPAPASLSLLIPPCRKILQEIIRHGFPQVIRGTFPLVDGMRAHRIGQLIEHLAVFHQLVDQHLAILIMHVVIAGAVNEEQVSFQAFHIRDGRTFAIAFRIGLRRVHVAFLVNGVVQPLVGYERNGNPRAEHIRIAEHAVEGLASSPAPACDANAGSIDERILTGQIEDSLCLIL